MARTVTRIGTALTVLGGTILTGAIGWVAFVWYAASMTELVGLLLVVAAGVVGARLASTVAGRIFADYNVAEVEVSGPISRDGGGVVPMQQGGTPVDAIVDQIEAADQDGNVEALLLKLNTPGGEVVPSDDVREAAKEFEGPTIAYATDLCASGGMWIASGCDELWARNASLIGSIGVIMANVTAGDLLEKAGLTYEGIKAGEYKDALNPLKDMSPDERAYAQGLADDFYDQFVERVTEGTDLSDEAVRDTEARIYMGTEATEIGLVDEIGRREDIEERLEDDLGEPVDVQPFEPQRGLRERINLGARSVAYAVGAGAASAVVGETEGPKLR